jgi:hypothetical protein
VASSVPEILKILVDIFFKRAMIRERIKTVLLHFPKSLIGCPGIMRDTVNGRHLPCPVFPRSAMNIHGPKGGIVDEA